jgi:hypothetical protein
VASSKARGSTASGLGNVSAKRSPKWGDDAGKTPPVVVRYLDGQRWIRRNLGTYRAFEYPTNRGRKKLDAASITTPRWLKTNPTFAFS